MKTSQILNPKTNKQKDALTSNCTNLSNPKDVRCWVLFTSIEKFSFYTTTFRILIKFNPKCSKYVRSSPPEELPYKYYWTYAQRKTKKFVHLNVKLSSRKLNFGTRNRNVEVSVAKFGMRLLTLGKPSGTARYAVIGAIEHFLEQITLNCMESFLQSNIHAILKVF